MEKAWRLILDKKHGGYYNMAVDEAILQGYSCYKTPTLRIYGWDEPFFSLGYNQSPQEIFNPDNAIPFVRRMTGGSAILHDQEITYSLVCSRGDLGLSGTVKESYQNLCSFIKDFYFQLGLRALFAKDALNNNLGKYSDFCFSSCQHFDLMLDGKKIGGNAQRRRKDLIFQHGSIPQKIDFSTIKSSVKKIENIEYLTTCLDQALGKSSDFYNLQSLLAKSFKLSFAIKLIQSRLFAEEAAMAKRLLETKYNSTSWNFYNAKI